MNSRVRIAAAATLIVSLVAVEIGRSGASAARGAPDGPNILVVMTDDQRADDMKVMREVRRRIGRPGTRFANAFATFPLCCPSRATYLTGQYAHNHGVLSNVPPNGGAEAFVGTDANTTAVALDDAGYRTGWIGKYLNRYSQLANQSPRYIPPGYDVWKTLISSYRVYDWKQLVNGRPVRWGSRRRDYQTDVFARQARSFVRSSLGADAPFFLTVATGVPHSESAAGGRTRFNPRPAERHRKELDGLRFARTPAFNERDVSDKPAFIRAYPRMTRRQAKRTKQRRLARLESLLAVDELVGSLVKTLRKQRALGETLIVFTSDNGYQLGEHRLGSKNWIYEESARVPLLVRGPGIPGGRRVATPAANLDVAPTIYEAAGVAPLLPQDGISLFGLIASPQSHASRDLLFETTKSRALRTPRYSYAEHDSNASTPQLDDELELYDLAEDPLQLRSAHADPGLAGLRAELAARLDELRDCAGASCH